MGAEIEAPPPSVYRHAKVGRSRGRVERRNFKEKVPRGGLFKEKRIVRARKVVRPVDAPDAPDRVGTPAPGVGIME